MYLVPQTKMTFHIQPAIDNCRDCGHRGLRSFCDLSPEALQRFDRSGMHISLAGRTIVFEEDQPVANIFVVCSGHLKLSSTSRDGKTMILRIAGPGDVLGLSAALMGQPHEVTAETLEPTQLKSVRRADFLSLFEDFAEVGQKAAVMAANEYRAAYLDARRLAISGSAAAKLAELLLDWVPAGQNVGTDHRFMMTLTHEELANLCGVSRETMTRLLNKFEREGLIERRGASMLLREPGKLHQMVA